MVMYRAFYFTLFRFPMLFISIVFFLIAWLSPRQIEHILHDSWQNDPFLVRLAFFSPLIVAGALHLVLLSGRAKIRPLADMLLASAPLLAIAMMVSSVTPASLAICGLALAIGLAVSWLAVRHLAGVKSATAPRIAGVLVILLWIAATLVLLASPISFPKAVGLGIVTIGLSMIGLAVALILVWPRAVVAYAALCLAAALYGPAQNPVPLVAGSERSSVALEEGLRAWLKSRKDLDEYKSAKRPYPVIVSSAEGGGIYAAAHAYLVLRAMQEMCPSFADHLFATVGVSGGSVGNLLFRGNLPGNAPASLMPCRKPVGPIALGPLATDFLSPTVANLLIGQFADFLVPYLQIVPDGGSILAQAVSTALPDNRRVVEPLGASWDPASSLPALIFLATDVHRGNRFVMSAIAGQIAHNAEAFPSGNIFSTNDIPANEAAVVSARFPWVTATARLLASEGDYRVLADGGYFENSGGDTVIDLVEQIRHVAAPCTEKSRLENPDSEQCKCPIVVHPAFIKDLEWGGCEQHIYLVYLPITGREGGTPGYSYERAANPSQSFFFDPLATMLATRITRGQLALTRARRVLLGDDADMAQGMNIHGGYFPHQMPIEELKLPLGWRLSPEALSSMRKLVAPTDACGFLPGGDQHDAAMYLADDDKWWEKWMAENAGQAPKDALPPKGDEALEDAKQLQPTLEGLARDQAAAAKAAPSGKQDRGRDAAMEEIQEQIAESNACNMLLVAWLFNPAGSRDYYGIPAWGHP